MASAALRDTRRRIRSVESIKKITRAMELIAASRIPKAIGRVNASKPYTAKLIEVIENVGGSNGSGSTHMLLEERPVATVGVVVVAADRGLAGAYATNIIRLAEQAMIGHRAAGRDVALFTVGKAAQSYFRFRGYRIRRAWLGVTDTPGYGDARSIANTVMEAYASGDVDKVETFYTTFRSALSQVPTAFDLLPIVPPERSADQAPVSYEFEPSPEEILDRLLPRYVEATVFNMLLESSASEHSARRRAMKAATDNADELVRRLTVAANRARQAEITTAITEIVGGAQALADAAAR
ncbi:MAG TPA: F0F1 ATP synthase subunit gamma [Acidimicrobiia bacterium]|nr:F0F1 ATP synthase subunit gamma [Acidimicrobiia bacterium]